MAESISEGTLSTFSKQVGDYVEQDEEIASIETDKIDVSVNAPEAGTIKELLVSEGDTVTVGQEIAVLEGGSGGAKTAKEEPKGPASADQPTSSDPEPKKEDSKKEEPKKEEPKKEAAPPKQEKPAPPKEEKKAPAPPPSEGKDSKTSAPAEKTTKFSRNEDRVSTAPSSKRSWLTSCR